MPCICVTCTTGQDENSDLSFKMELKKQAMSVDIMLVWFELDHIRLILLILGALNKYK